MRPPRLLTAFALAACVAGGAQAQSLIKLVPGSAFHGVHGIRFSPEGELYAGSVAGQSLYAVDVATGAVRTVAGPPEGMADDIAFGPDGQVVWTAISAGVVYTRRGDGPIEVLAKDMPGANSVAFSRDGKRLFLGLVFAGDGVWELDPAGRKPPRLIKDAPGGFNSFSPGPDGWLYGPLWFKGQVVRINPDTGELAVVAEGFKTPAAAKFDSKDNLYVIDTKLGGLVRVDIRTGGKSKVAQLTTSLDNIAIDPNDRLFVSNMADNAILEVDTKTGVSREVVKAGLSYPADLAVASEDGRDTLYLADVFAYRSVDGQTGKVTDIARMHSDELEYPTGVSVEGRQVLLVSSISGVVQAFDRASGQRTSLLHGFTGPTDAVAAADGAVIVAEMGGKLIRAKGEARVTLARDLAGPAGLARGSDGSIYVAEALGGRILRIDPNTGAQTVIASGLNLPKAVAITPQGRLVVLEVGARQLVEMDAAGGGLKVLAKDLPVGLITKPMPSAGGLAVGGKGDIYVASDIENAIYKIVAP